MDPHPCCRWRSSGSRRLGILSTPDIDTEPVNHIQPGTEFSITRVAVVDGRRYLQLADGRGWVPECSRKDSSRIVVEPLESVSKWHAEQHIARNASTQTLATPYPPTEIQIRYLRVTVLSTRSPNIASTQLGRICLRVGGEVIELKAFKAEAIEGRSPVREGPEKVLAPKGKWLDLRFRENEQSVLLISAPAIFKVDDIAFQTASDQPGRDPIRIRVDASRDGWEWVLVHMMGEDERSAMYMPSARLAWTPWFQLRVDRQTVEAVNAETVLCAHTQLPPELSWWCNADERLCIFKQLGIAEEPVDYLQCGAIFAALSTVTHGGRHFLQLPENRGWVSTCASKDVSHQIVQHIGWQHTPAEIVHRLQEASRNEHSSTLAIGERKPVSLKSLRMIVLATRSSNVVSTQISQIALRCSGKLLQLDAVAVENPRGQCPLNEGPERVLRPTGKWLDMNFIANQQSELLLVFEQEVQVEELSFCTCSDMESRDPVKFRIDGSQNGQDWFVLQERGDNFPTPRSRRTWSPWILLRASTSIPIAWKSTVVFSTPRHRCLVADCTDVFSRTEGYVVKGKLLMHMLRKHPHAKEIDEIKATMEKREASKPSKCGHFARKTFSKKAQIVHKERNAKTSPSKARLPDVEEPRTPVRRGTKRNIDAVGNADTFTPSPHAAKDIALLSAGSRLARIQNLGQVSIGSRVDVEAEVQSMSSCKKGRLLKGAPGDFMPMRRFGLRDGEATCWWVLCGKRAETFPDSVVGQRIKIFGTKVHLFKGRRHLGGCSACHQLLLQT